MTESTRASRPESDDSTNPTTASPTASASEQDALTTSSYETYRPEGQQLGGAQMVNQLQSMIDNVSQQAGPVVRQATPVLRQIAAKAAELAALAAERAGPLAHRAADVTQDVGIKVAARSREVAADLRRAADEEPTSGGSGTAARPGGSGSESIGSSRSSEETERASTTPGL